MGVATFRWRKDTSSGWEASGVLTSTSFQTLDNGVKVKFTGGAGADFNVGDRWTFKANRFFSKGRLIDWDPDTPWRSSSLETPSFLTIDLGSAKNVKAVCIFNHNITSGATVLRLLANTSDSWGSPPFTLNLTHATGPILAYLDQTYQFWRVEVTDSGNSDPYIEIGELFLGDYFEPSRNFILRSPRGEVAQEEENPTAAGIPKLVLRNRVREFELFYGGISDTDKSSFETLFQAIKDRANKRSRGLFLNQDSAVTTDTYMVDWMSPLFFEPTSFGRWDLETQLREKAALV